MILYFYPSPYGIDWSSPHRLARTALLNQLNRDGRSIGHVHIELRSGARAENGSPCRLITGMSQKNHAEERALLFRRHIGLGILFHDFLGEIERTEAAAGEIERRCRRGTISYLKFLISAETHARALRYAREFVERGHSAHYGLPNRPLHGEGGGCTAFGASFLEVTGLMEEVFLANWTQRILVPMQWLGGSYADPGFFGERSPRSDGLQRESEGASRDRTVPLSRLLFPFRPTRWAEPLEPHREVFFWDPDLMHRWVQRVWREESERPTGRYALERRAKALGLALDRRGVKPPEGPSFWKNPA